MMRFRLDWSIAQSVSLNGTSEVYLAISTFTSVEVISHYDLSRGRILILDCFIHPD